MKQVDNILASLTWYQLAIIGALISSVVAWVCASVIRSFLAFVVVWVILMVTVSVLFIRGIEGVVVTFGTWLVGIIQMVIYYNVVAKRHGGKFRPEGINGNNGVNNG